MDYESFALDQLSKIDIPTLIILGAFILRLHRKTNDKMDKGFEKIDEKFKKIDEKFDEKFKKIDEKFDKVNEKMDKGFEKLTTKIDGLKNEIHGTSERIVRLETIKEIKESEEG